MKDYGLTRNLMAQEKSEFLTAWLMKEVLFRERNQEKELWSMLTEVGTKDSLLITKFKV